jgi:hypothetical protein
VGADSILLNVRPANALCSPKYILKNEHTPRISGADTRNPVLRALLDLAVHVRASLMLGAAAPIGFPETVL